MFEYKRIKIFFYNQITKKKIKNEERELEI